jgi:tyrosinase
MGLDRLNRRDVLKGIAGGVGASALGAQPRPAVAQTVRIRPNLANAPATLIASFRKGVAAMQARPVSNPRSWQYWANVHGTPGPQNAAGTWKQCQHGSFFFLPWHRMYLFYFEKVLRAASGDPNFTLPYWRWTSQRAMPLPFRSPANATNKLFVASPNRGTGINAGGLLPSTDVSVSPAFSFTNFTAPTGDLSFGGRTVSGFVHFGAQHGQFEASPHDVIHDDIGDGGWMSDPDQAARDPVFYVHHCNIDRLWKHWLALGGGRVNPTGNAAWMNQTFRFFDHDANAVVDVPVRNFLDTTTQLHYRYDDDPVPAAAIAAAPGPAPAAIAAAAPEHGDQPAAATSPAAESASPAPEAEPLASSSQVIRLGQERVSAPLAVAPEQSDRLRNLIPGVGGTAPAGPSATPQAARSGRIILRLSGIDFDRPPGKPYQVYVNLPEGQDPDPHSIYFAGVLGFFGLSAAQHDPGHSGGQQPGGVRLFDITDLVARQTAAGVWTGDQPSVTFVLSGVPEPGGTLRANPQANARIGKVEILRQQ